ncbi:MAG: DNA mismatch repair endonuclease MutL [Holosporales bacterium]|jgi:DNA mismatch repair protein MutL|nr:DNA mismatch repair endonuclease MutL [Holosporales bacterium]
MGKIKLLSEEIINQIAAGEIVERPAAALKEIVENSIDAGAKNVDVFLKNGGMGKIVVEDDGIGLSEDDIKMAIKRHATSKLTSDNLFDIRSYGFRGEAIPSIASVSRFSIESHNHGISVDFSEESSIYPSATTHGTKVTIEDLFSKLPARLKFLRSSGTELTHCLSVIENFALISESVNFTVRSDSGTLMTFKDDSIDDRVSKIFGEELFKRAVYFAEEDKAISVKGYLFHPIDSRHSQSYQKIFVNGRVVKDRVVAAAIRNAYRELIPGGRFAIAVVFITIDPFHVDVNVSPTKSEVRFRDCGYVQKMLTAAISRNLAKFDRIAAEIRIPIASEAAVPKRASYQRSLEASYVMEGTTGLQISHNILPPAEYEEPELPEIKSEPCFFGTPVVQLFDSYIVTVVDDGVFVIDQHAVHEKITQHKMMQSISVQNKRFISRSEVLQLSGKQLSIAQSMIDHINSCGFSAEIVQSSIIISAIPQIVNIAEAIGFIEDLLESNEFAADVNIVDIMKRRIADIACHNSIRFGRRLSIDEMIEITRQMEETPAIHQCNHHRPSFIKITKSQLEKMFERG